MALTEPSGGSDLQAMSTVARRDGGRYVVDGAKMWITNARRSGLIALMCKTDPSASPRHRGISILLVEHGPGLTVSRDLPKLGYKGVESCELSFEGYEAPLDAVLGGEEGRGFVQMMRGLEVGRIRSRRALWASGAPRWRTPALRPGARGVRQADLAAPVHRQLPRRHGHPAPGGAAADPRRRRAPGRGRALRHGGGHGQAVRVRAAMQTALDAVRIHGAAGYSTEFDVERYFRDAPLMIVGEGTNEIQRNVIVKQLVERHRI